MSLKSGFYNAIETAAGEYDRVYSADEYTNFYSAFLKDGVRRSALDDLKCTASGLVVTVGAGYAICGSKWIHNDTAFVLPTITPPAAQYSRIDGVFLHVDVNESARAASFVYREGTPAETPVAPERIEGSGVYELCLCYVNVPANAASVSIIDKRADSAVCGWVTTPVGYDDYFARFDSEFDEYMQNAENEFDAWFANIRETVAITTLFKQYTQLIETTGSSTSTVQISIVQYDPTGVDILQVYCNGMLLIDGEDYTTSGTTITFDVPKIAGTKILIVVYKSIDGAGLGSVSDAVEELQNDVAELQTAVEDVSGLIATQNFNFSFSLAIAGKTIGEIQQTITKEGYTPVGILQIVPLTGLLETSLDLSLIGFDVSKNGDADVIGVQYYNSSSSSRTLIGLRATVLYIKTVE